MGAPDRLDERAGSAMTPMIPPTIRVGTPREVLISHHLQVCRSWMRPRTPCCRSSRLNWITSSRRNMARPA